MNNSRNRSVIKKRDAESARKQLTRLRDGMMSSKEKQSRTLGVLDASYRKSGENLLAYLALRRHDIRPLQMKLAAMGLSSLGRSEGYILSAVSTVIDVLERLTGEPTSSSKPIAPDMKMSERLLDEHALALFGAAPVDRDVRIMVTMPSEAADNYSMIRDLLATKMDSVRINCAHDGPEAWARMIEHVRRAEKEVGRPCKVMMDLAGPKLRTGPIDPGPAVRKAKPQRDRMGLVVSPARIWLTMIERPSEAPSNCDASLRVSGKWLSSLKPDMRVTLDDARGSRRHLNVVECTEQGCWAEAHKTIYFTPGLTLTSDDRKGRETTIAAFPSSDRKIRLQEDDLLLVTRGEIMGHPASLDSAGNVLTPATIGCTLPQVFNDVKAGQIVWFDDGKIGGVIESAAPDELRVRITHAPGGANLSSDKGINFPQSTLQLNALGEDDVQALTFAAEHADVVEMSFVNEPGDVDLLFEHLERLDAMHLGIVLKIETRKGFERLPALLMSGMRHPKFGVMIARGDLAVEGGFERMAELQEEILCLCEAAHVPVIWATQVLESLAKKGSPSRAEITDAATGVRAECVMLNKGPHVLKAVETLDDLLTRMQSHHHKKRQMLRRLAVAQRPNA
ncbi:pyruvate kinase [Pseudomonas matsuisoli]|uniref:pyruvate kinase n=1 Tax=Pseudomonas matsuisoli TaxID=1515666 RepID=A0A917PM55_9PSED|nr:pyruvate kinase [Pseudomonas matsuisoli]GGJ83839.1 pyruvate kinase [Pseudomonas matsuisoli]